MADFNVFLSNARFVADGDKDKFMAGQRDGAKLVLNTERLADKTNDNKSASHALLLQQLNLIHKPADYAPENNQRALFFREMDAILRAMNQATEDSINRLRSADGIDKFVEEQTEMMQQAAERREEAHRVYNEALKKVWELKTEYANHLKSLRNLHERKQDMDDKSFETMDKPDGFDYAAYIADRYRLTAEERLQRDKERQNLMIAEDLTKQTMSNIAGKLNDAERSLVKSKMAILQTEMSAKHARDAFKERIESWAKTRIAEHDAGIAQPIEQSPIASDGMFRVNELNAFADGIQDEEVRARIKIERDKAMCHAGIERYGDDQAKVDHYAAKLIRLQEQADNLDLSLGEQGKFIDFDALKIKDLNDNEIEISSEMADVQIAFDAATLSNAHAFDTRVARDGREMRSDAIKSFLERQDRIIEEAERRRDELLADRESKLEEIKRFNRELFELKNNMFWDNVTGAEIRHVNQQSTEAKRSLEQVNAELVSTDKTIELDSKLTDWAMERVEAHAANGKSDPEIEERILLEADIKFRSGMLEIGADVIHPEAVQSFSTELERMKIRARSMDQALASKGKSVDLVGEINQELEHEIERD